MCKDKHEGARQNPRILVGIASYGGKNVPHLLRIIEGYRGMPFEVDIVVFSEAPKELGGGVEVIVGLPSRNPWTLPFAHKAVFAERADRYDLFVYSEDDIHAREDHIRAFVNATESLSPDEIAGFIRYELDSGGRCFVNEPWKHYHWKPDSVRRRGAYRIAEFTNEHTGFYILTQDQLKRAIASGGFLREPYRGRYDWPETAATDPYTCCGFSKVICISHLEDFLVHHMPNPYVHKLDVTLEAFKEQIKTLEQIEEGTHPATTLCEVESLKWPRAWQKSYYEQPDGELIDMVPAAVESVLSVGCGSGAFESELTKRGIKVTAFPLDSVIGAVAEREGVEMIYGNWEECFHKIADRTFDCVVLTNLLHLNPDPERLVKQCARAVRPDGSLIVGGPNLDRAPWRLKRILGVDGYRKLKSFDSSGFSLINPRALRKPLEEAGLQVADVSWLNHEFARGPLRGNGVRFGNLTARDWRLRAVRSK